MFSQSILEDDDFEILTTEESFEKDKKLLANQLSELFKSQIITLDEKGYIIQLMHNQLLRESVADILWREIVQTRVLESFDCLKLIADVLRFILTLFVHEQVNDYRLLYAILETAMQTSVSRDKVTKRPK